MKQSRPTHGGKRKGAGRKKAIVTLGEPIVQRTVTLLKSDLEFLKSLNPSISQAIRQLIEQVRTSQR